MTDIYIVNQSSQFTTDMNDLVAAMQEQVSRDFAPLWGITATIYAAETAPEGAWAITLVDSLDAVGGNNLAYHINDTGSPRAQIGVGTCLSYNASPTQAVSHELLEMLADPNNDKKAGIYMLEVADPVTNDHYTIGNITVSNFVTPRYFDLSNIGHFDQLGYLDAGCPAMTYGGMIMSWNGSTWVESFARDQQGAISWRAHLNGRSYHRAVNMKVVTPDARENRHPSLDPRVG